MEKMSWIDEFEGKIDEVEIGTMVNQLNLPPLDLLAIAAAVFERRGTAQNHRKRKANCFSHSVKKKIRTTGHGITCTVSLSKQDLPLPLMKRGSFSFYPHKNPIILDDEAKKTALKKSISTGPQTTPDMPVELKNKITAMRGTELKLVIQKPLFKSDCSPGEGRLSIPIRQIRETYFLTEEEKAQLETRQENGVKKSEIKVDLFDPKGKKWIPSLRKWDMKKKKKKTTKKTKKKKNSEGNNPMYVLVSEWNNIVKYNKLKPKTLIQLWSFRIGLELCLMLVKVGGQRNNNGGRNEGDSSGTGQNRDRHL